MNIGIIGAGSIGYNVAKKPAPNHDIKLAASKLTEGLEAKAVVIGGKAGGRAKEASSHGAGGSNFVHWSPHYRE